MDLETVWTKLRAMQTNPIEGRIWKWYAIMVFNEISSMMEQCGM